jgi:hypothetical protein
MVHPHMCSRVVAPALQGLNFDAAGLMAAEYQRVMKRARDLRQAELEEELAAIKHDPTVLAGQTAITQCHESALRRLAPICGSRGLCNKAVARTG